MTGLASVVIPTIGRADLLAQALASLALCDPAPDEVIVVDQSGEPETARVVEASGLPQARTIESPVRSIGSAVNAGMSAARHDLLFIMHDDCTAEPNWIETGTAAMWAVPAGIATGKVLPVGPDPRAVPSCVASDEPRDYTGGIELGGLYPANMVCAREALEAFGGFDPLITPAAEDIDLEYRWLRAGRSLRYVPEMVVHHHDWRSKEDLVRLYVDYHRGEGMFYAKHLRAGDLTMVRFVARDLVTAGRGLLSRLLYRTPGWTDPRRGIPGGLPRGLYDGWQAFRSA